MRSKYAFSVVLLLLLQLGCSGVSNDPSGKNLCTSDVTAKCLIAMAQMQAEDIEPGPDSVTAITEVASALFAVDDSSAAIAMLDRATAAAATITDSTQRADSMTEIVAVMAANQCPSKRLAILQAAQEGAAAIEDEPKRWDLTGRLIVAQAQCGDPQVAVDVALAMPQSDEMLASYKARTLHDLAPVIARANDIEAAERVIASIDMGISYYRAVARTEVARIALQADEIDTARRLLKEADKIGQQQDNGYFKAGVLREIGGTFEMLNAAEDAGAYFAAAAMATEIAPTEQHRARALSRIATVLADFEHFDAAMKLVPNAVQIARHVESEQLRYWSFYEIAGGAAFSGDFATATALLDEIPEALVMAGNALKSAAQRDVVWGLTKHGRSQDALQLALSIGTARERVQALSRMARLLADRDMHALPRYL